MNYNFTLNFEFYVDTWLHMFIGTYVQVLNRFFNLTMYASRYWYLRRYMYVCILIFQPPEYIIIIS